MITEPQVANGIAVVFGVLSAVDFDDQPSFPANEVHNVRSDRLLPQEFHSTK